MASLGHSELIKATTFSPNCRRDLVQRDALQWRHMNNMAFEIIATRLFFQQLVQVEGPHYWPRCKDKPQKIQYIPRNMHTVFALLCFVVVKHWLILSYPSGLLHWHCGNLAIAPVPAKQPWWIWINTSREFIMNDCITTTKQSTTKPCAYFLGYTVGVFPSHKGPVVCEAFPYHDSMLAWYGTPSCELLYINTVETLYNTINFCWSTHKRHSIARPKGRGMGVFCEFKGQHIV